MEEHLQHLRVIFNMLIKHQLLVRKSKCYFGAYKVEYLGHFISAEGVSTDPKKIVVVQEWPTPKYVKELWGFLGLVGYYIRFIRRYGWISKLLTDLLKKEGLSRMTREIICSKNKLEGPKFLTGSEVAHWYLDEMDIQANAI
ncbi:uncharacterized mitochondrial protein AtMg00860-like [Solanum verrucosum]|uniref:uncharacterized mitochondrial protein AtMg00860-like n=1 Tax=Solanum verrucosum TaxID=315347 RepID=UPI0020D083F5|nr:uncharacterized mitochondrial protein AtMg00860-like [Solanum verrucosum]